MRKLAFFLLLTLVVSPALAGQTLDVPRVEVGFQADLANVSAIGPIGGGGVRFHYNFTNHYALDADITYHQQDVSPGNNFLLAPVGVGQRNVLVGLRAGAREQRVGAFFRARGGILHFDSVHGAAVLSRRNVPAFDAGITVESYHGPMVLRADLGELIVPFGNATVFNGFPPSPARLGTRLSFLLGLGIAVRFGGPH